eukprot:COSAG04_NODE_48_length_31217_cov_204.046758_14_plen_133_part_00
MRLRPSLSPSLSLSRSPRVWFLWRSLCGTRPGAAACSRGALRKSRPAHFTYLRLGLSQLLKLRVIRLGLRLGRRRRLRLRRLRLRVRLQLRLLQLLGLRLRLRLRRLLRLRHRHSRSRLRHSRCRHRLRRAA